MTHDLPKNRKDAASSGVKYYFTGKECINGHIEPRFTSNGGCIKCNSVSKEYQRKWASLNKDKISAKSKRQRENLRKSLNKRRLENPEKYSMYDKKYRKENPNRYRSYCAKRRAIMNGAGGEYTEKDIATILENQSYKCNNEYCKEDLRKGYHIDHIMPLALGGSNWPSNLQCLCPRCNMRKGAKHPDDWNNRKKDKE